MRKSIVTKIMIIYAVIMICTLIASNFLYNVAVSDYIEDTYIETLSNDSDRLVEVVKETTSYTKGKVNISSINLIEELLSKRLDKNLKDMNTYYAVINHFGRTIYSNGVTNPRSGEVETDFFNISIKPQLNDYFDDSIYENVQVEIVGQVYNVRIVPITKDISTDIDGGWIVNYFLSTKSASLSEELVKILVYTLLLSIVVVFIFTYFSARSLAKPIIKIKDAAARISHYEFDTRVELNSENELGELATAVNEMAGELKQYDVNLRRFIQNASHELKTPLMSIQGYAEGIKDGVFKDQDAALSVIIDESQRLKRIVDNLILLTKLETNDDLYLMKSESLYELINDCVGKVDGAYRAENIELNFDVTRLDSRISTSCDKDKMTQALINILSNCLRYAKSKVDIKVTVDKIFGKATIVISDDGNGFAPGEENVVFERFYKGKQGHVGLGLSITQTIINRHHGKIRAYNNHKGGAVFEIVLFVSNDLVENE